jgi:hypothetical protein
MRSPALLLAAGFFILLIIFAVVVTRTIIQVQNTHPLNFRDVAATADAIGSATGTPMQAVSEDRQEDGGIVPIELTARAAITGTPWARDG